MKKIQSLLLAGAAVFSLAAGGTALSTAASANQNSTYQPQPAQTTTQAVRPRFNIYSHSNGRLAGKNALIHHHSIHLQARAAIAMDGRTGQIVYRKNANQPRLVASTGKLMTFYLAERQLRRHPNAWHQRLAIPNNLIKMGHNPALDGFRFQPDQRYSLRNIFRTAFVGSADNAAIRLGEWAGGNNSRFIRMMNHQARLWHLNTNFTSASGLENNDLAPYGLWIRGRYYDGNRISAKSLALITYHLIKDFPKIMKLSRVKKFWLDHQLMYNYDNLLPGRRFYERHLDVDGLKTGYTPAAGLCFVGTSKKPHHDRLITVVLDDPNEFAETDKLMKFVYRYSKLFRK